MVNRFILLALAAVLAAHTSALCQEPATIASTQPAGLEKLWTDLAGDEPLAPFKSAVAMAAKKDQAVSFIETKIAFPPPTAKLIRDLDSDEFAVRDAARKELLAGGIAIEPALRAALEAKQTTEVRTAIQNILDAPAEAARSAAAHRSRWTVRTLEMIGTPAAGRLLERMSGSFPYDAIIAERRLASSRPASQPASTSSPDESTLLVYWQVALHPDLAEKVLFDGEALDVQGKHHVGVMCDTKAIYGLIRMNKDARPDGYPAAWVGNAHLVRAGHKSQIPRTFFQGDLEAPLTIDWPMDALASVSTERHPPKLSVKLMPATSAGGKEETLDYEFRPAPGKAACLVAYSGPVNDCRRCVVTIMHTVSVPTELLGNICPAFAGYVEGQTWVAGGIEDRVRLAKEVRAWDQMVEELSHTPDAKWTCKLASGAEVRLLRVRATGENRIACWDGDGWPLPAVVDPSRRQEGLECTFQYRLNPGDAWTGVTRRYVSAEVGVGISSGPWKPEGELGPGKSVTAGGVEFKFKKSDPVHSLGADVWIESRELPDDLEIAVGALDKDGKLIGERSTSPSVIFRDGARPQGDTGVEMRQYRIDPAYYDDAGVMQPATRFVLLSRQRGWAKFKDIAEGPRSVDELRKSASTQSQPASVPATR